jgi:hypothetical protein
MSFNLYCCCAPCLFLSCDKVELTPEVLLLFLLDDGADFVECFLVFLLLGNLLPDFEMLPPESFSVFLIKYAFFLARLQSAGNLLYQQLQGIWYVAMPSCSFQVTVVLDLPFMVPEM